MMQFLFTKTPLSFFVASFWRDEAFSYLMARLSIPTLLWSTAQDANPPLYYLLLKLWMTLFGTSEIALRSLSLVFFWATLYVAFLIMRNIYKLSTKKSAFYLLFFIINPFLHYFAFEARMYSMVAFLATLLFYTLMKKQYRLYAYVALLALFTHYFLILVIAFQVVFVFITSPKTERKHFFSPLMKAFLWYIPWIIILIFAHPPVGKSFWVAPPSWTQLFLLPAIVLTGYEQGTAWIMRLCSLFVSLLVAGIIIFGFSRHLSHNKKSHFILLLGWSLGIPLFIFIISLIKPVFVPRYFIFAPVGLVLLIVVCLESIKNISIRILLMTTIVVFLLFYSTNQILTRTKAPLKKTFSIIASEMRKNDVVYVTHEFDFHPAEYYLPSKQVYLYKKTYEELPWFIGKVLINKHAFQDTLPQYPVRAFIVNNDGSYSVQSSQ